MRLLKSHWLAFGLSAMTLLATESHLLAQKSLSVTGEVTGFEDISAATLCNDLIYIGADEGTGETGEDQVVQILKLDGDQLTVIDQKLLSRSALEMDIEAIACGEDAVYIAGSHSAKRPRIKSKKPYEKNRKAFKQDSIEVEKTRNQVVKLAFDDSVESISLENLLKKDEVLSAWMGIASKENGIDIEGLAYSDRALYAGFRGPVFRGNYVPVLKFSFAKKPEKKPYEILYVKLGGFGVRDLVKVVDGFLILAGPVGDAVHPYKIYHWNGKDQVPGSDQTESGELKELGEIALKPHLKPEGLAVLKELPDRYEVLIACDGASDQKEIFSLWELNK